MANEEAAAAFDPLRPRLIRIAYRMLIGCGREGYGPGGVPPLA
jgi:hypothetical protein